MRGPSWLAQLAEVHASSETITRLAHLIAEVRREFPHLPSEHVEMQAKLIADDLLADANFDNFVPLLTTRYLRERLAAYGHEVRAAAKPPTQILATQTARLSKSGD
jgi:hypothetical protein